MGERLAIVLGYDGLGAVQYITDLFRRYGYDRVVALVDNPQRYTTAPGVTPPEFVEVANAFDPESLTAAVRDIAGHDEAPFLCVQDQVTLAYLVARKQLYGGGQARFHVPEAGIARARLKPHARLLWNRAGVDATKWTVLRSGERPDGGLTPGAPGAFVVKPISGTASRMVFMAQSWDEVEAAAEKIRAFWETELPAGARRVFDIDGCQYDIAEDVLVEERLSGAEVCLDGFSWDKDVTHIAQHKETLHQNENFAGDGGIYAPPDADLHDLKPNPPLHYAGPLKTTAAEFQHFVERAVAALELWNWAFHCEVKASGGSVRAIELNPRAPGGLLWMTASQHLGLDPIEYIVRAHLRVPTPVAKRGWVTTQFPIYAEQEGIIAAIEGVPEARAVLHVHVVRPAKAPGDVIRSKHLENYAAFVCIHAPNHAAARRAEAEVRALIRVRYSD